MLTFSEHAWQHWLNPNSNLNRYRLPDHRRVFEEVFRKAQVIVLEHDLASFEGARPRICPEFLTGDVNIDTVTLILVLASFSRS